MKNLLIQKSFSSLTSLLFLIVSGPASIAQTPTEPADLVITDFIARQEQKEGAEEYEEAREIQGGD